MRIETTDRAGRRVRKSALTGAVLGLALLGAAAMHAQEPGEQAAGRAQFAGMQRVAGEVTGVAGATLTIKAEDGSTVQVVTTDNTRVMKGRGITVKVADVKVGDGVMAMGNLDAPNKTMHAAILMATDAATLKALKDNLGKTYIAGRVTAIDLDNAKLTVERRDKVVQTIGFDETTSFKRGRVGRGGFGMMGAGGGAAAGGSASAPAAEAGESITLADVKVGDEVTGPGSVKGGTFVPTQLTVMTPGQGRRRGGEGTTAPPVAGTAAPAGPGSN